MADTKKAKKMFFNCNVRHGSDTFKTNDSISSDHILFKEFNSKWYLSKISPNTVVIEKNWSDCKEIKAELEETKKVLEETKKALEEVSAELEEAKEAIKVLKEELTKAKK